jgi:hypothetical protein
MDRYLWNDRHSRVGRYAMAEDGRSMAFELALTHFIVSNDVDRSSRFYTEVLGGEADSLRRTLLRGACQQLDHHQRRWWTDR